MYAFATGAAPARRGASMAYFVTALMTGQMVGPALGGAIASLTGWRPAIGVAAAIGLGVAAACGAWWRSSGGRLQAGSTSGTAAGPDAPAPPPGGFATRPELAALAAAPFATFFGMAGLTQTLVPLIGDGELGLSASAVGLAVGLGAAVRFFGAWTAGVASDRLSRKVVLVPSLVTMAGGAAVLALPPTTLSWGIGIGLVALGSSGISVAAAAVADRVPHDRLGHELGVFRLLGDLGLLVGPALTGFAYGAAGPGLAGGLAAAVFAAAALATLLWVRTPDARWAEPEDTGDIMLG
jgi:MFS family permease